MGRVQDPDIGAVIADHEAAQSGKLNPECSKVSSRSSRYSIVRFYEITPQVIGSPSGNGCTLKSSYLQAGMDAHLSRRIPKREWTHLLLHIPDQDWANG